MSNKLLKQIDKEICKAYIKDPESFSKDPIIKSIADFGLYEKTFEERNGFSLQSISKKYKPEDIDKVFSLIEISKNMETQEASEGICFALGIVLGTLYWESKYYFSNWAENFNDESIVKALNLFSGNLKILKDDLRFITFDKGVIQKLPITQAISKCYDEYCDYPSNYVSEWDIRDINSIKKNLELTILLINVFLKTIPSDSIFSDWTSSLVDFLELTKDLNDNFENIVILANNSNLISVAPKAPSVKNKPDIFYNQLTQKNMIKKYDVEICKADDIEGFVTGIVLMPDIEDLQGQVISKEEIRKAMVYYMLNHQQFDIMHNEKVLKSSLTDGEERQVALIQNVQLEQEVKYGDKTVPAGTWIQETYILDKELKKSVKNKTLKGYSVFGTADITPKE